jgi:hypothetical protein
MFEVSIAPSYRLLVSAQGRKDASVAVLNQVVFTLPFLVYIETREVMSPEQFVAGVALQIFF